MDDLDKPASTSSEGEPFRDIPVVLTISVGHARTPIRDLLALERNAVIPLDTKIDDPVVIHAGDQVIAYGELQELDGVDAGKLAVMITRMAGTNDVD